MVEKWRFMADACDYMREGAVTLWRSVVNASIIVWHLCLHCSACTLIRPIPVLELNVILELTVVLLSSHSE